MKARLVWPPYPYRAGFCITDDTDAATFEQVRAVYDFLLARNFRTTKTVWAFPPRDRCGIPPLPDSALRGVTLEDGRYLDYCRRLHEKGFEICLHGASAGNNTRPYTRAAFEFLERNIGPSDTFICHAKNADNLYWEHRVTAVPLLRGLLRRYLRHACSGEVESSPFFWGDLCREKIRQVRLFRTRRLNTLKSNPSMPYFDGHKPYVNGWFSATKRRILDCAAPPARAALKRDFGLTVLYQYLYRYADPRTLRLDPRFLGAIGDIGGDPEILVDTVSGIMRRLRLIQGLFLAQDRGRFWLINLNTEDVTDVQIAAPGGLGRVASDGRVDLYDDRLVLPRIPASALVSVETGRTLCFTGPRCKTVDRWKHAVWNEPFGTLFVNLSESPWTVSGTMPIQAHSFAFLSRRATGDAAPLSCLTRWEEIRLTMGQMWIIVREMLLKGRPLDVDVFLDDRKEIKLEDHDNW